MNDYGLIFDDIKYYVSQKQKLFFSFLSFLGSENIDFGKQKFFFFERNNSMRYSVKAKVSFRTVYNAYTNRLLIVVLT